MYTNFKNVTQLGILFFIISILGIQTAEATVGGPSYINNFKYNPKDESVYYTEYDHGGRGCPPTLSKISLVDSKVSIVYSCDEGMALIDKTYAENKNYELASTKVTEEINKITKDFKDLSPINLKSNEININLKFQKEIKSEFDPEFIMNSAFNATIVKGDKNLLETSIYGCDARQPFSFLGYSIPGFDKKIVILQSAKSDCMEGGYIRESLIVLGGLDNIDKTPLNFYKGNEALVPNEGTLIVYSGLENIIPSDEVSTSTEKNKNIVNKVIQGDLEVFDESTSENSNVIIIAIILSLIVGFVFGKIKKSSNKNIG